MKRFIAIAATTICCLGNEMPAKAETARVYNGDIYTRCTFVQGNMFCEHNDKARALDDWHAKKNSCNKKVAVEAVRRYGDDGYGNGNGILQTGTAANTWYMNAMKPCFAR